MQLPSSTIEAALLATAFFSLELNSIWSFMVFSLRSERIFLYWMLLAPPWTRMIRFFLLNSSQSRRIVVSVTFNFCASSLVEMKPWEPESVFPRSAAFLPRFQMPSQLLSFQMSLRYVILLVSSLFSRCHFFDCLYCFFHLFFTEKMRKTKSYDSLFLCMKVFYLLCLFVSGLYTAEKASRHIGLWRPDTP